MNLAGFVHTKDNLKKKQDLKSGKIPIENSFGVSRKDSHMDVVSQSQRSKGTRRSSRRGDASLSPSKRSTRSRNATNNQVDADDVEEDDDEEQSQCTDYRDIEQPPMNEEIEPPSDNGVDYSNNQMGQATYGA